MSFSRKVLLGVLLTLAVSLLGSGQQVWFKEAKVDPLTDEKTIYVYTFATWTENVLLVWLLKPCLVVRYNETKKILEVYVNVMDYIGYSGSFRVLYRFDTGDVVEERWLISTSGTAVFSPKPDEFLKMLRKSKELVFRVFTYFGEAKTVKFRVEGFPEF